MIESLASYLGRLDTTELTFTPDAVLFTEIAPGDASRWFISFCSGTANFVVTTNPGSFVGGQGGIPVLTNAAPVLLKFSDYPGLVNKTWFIAPQPFAGRLTVLTGRIRG